MRKFLVALLLCFVCSTSYSQVACYDRLIWDVHYGFYFEENINDSVESVVYVGKDKEEAIRTIDEMIGICHIDGSQVVTYLNDAHNDKFMVVKKEVPYPNYLRSRDGVRFLFIYSKDNDGAWRITEAELRDILKQLYNIQS